MFSYFLKLSENIFCRHWRRSLKHCALRSSIKMRTSINFFSTQSTKNWVQFLSIPICNISVLLNYFMRPFFLYAPENYWKPMVFCCFQRVQKETSDKNWVKKDSKRPLSHFLSSGRNNLDHNSPALEISYVEEVRSRKFCRYQGTNGLDALLFFFEKAIQKMQPSKAVLKNNCTFQSCR